MENILYYLIGSLLVASISFTISVTSIANSFRELVSKIHPKIEELIHCPWCLSFWMLLVLINTWSVSLILVYPYYILNMFVTLFSMYSIIGLVHYVLLRAYKPVTENMLNRMKEKRQLNRVK